jgi:ABC-2 type transport system ATP-binding protein
VAELLERFELVEAAAKPVTTYSGGMRRKLDLGASLVGAPELLLLDEPTTGLDPRSRNDLWDAIRDLVAAGTDVLLTTQYLDEADHLANRIAIIDHGKVIAEGTPDELKTMAGDDVIQVHVAHLADVNRAIEVLAPMGTGEPRVDRPTRSVAVPVDKGSARLLEAVRAMDALGLEVSDIGLRRATLDEVFLSLTGWPGVWSPDADAGAGAGRPRRGRKAKPAPAPEESLR